MPITSETNTLLWERMLDADMRGRYYLRLSAMLTRLEMGLSVLTAVLTSGAFLSLVVDSPMPELAKWAALAAAFSSTWLLISKQGKRAEIAGGRAKQWLVAQAELERLWVRRSRLEEAEVYKHITRLDKELTVGVDTLVRELPLNHRLRQLAYREVIVARGLVSG
jgi:hypothetical protein